MVYLIFVDLLYYLFVNLVFFFYQRVTCIIKLIYKQYTFIWSFVLVVVFVFAILEECDVKKFKFYERNHHDDSRFLVGI